METLHTEDFFMADDFFTSSFDPMYDPEVPLEPDIGMVSAPFGSEMQAPPNLKTDALLAMFDSSLASIFASSPTIDDLYSTQFSEHACGPNDLRINDGITPDSQMLDIPTVGGFLEDPDRHGENHHISSYQYSNMYEMSTASPETGLFHGHSLPQTHEAEYNSATERLSDSIENDSFRRPSQASSFISGVSSSSENEPRNSGWQVCATEDGSVKPRRKRGRKRSNLSPEERRARRLERGRLAANKCRKKKREMECELESKASNLLVERDRMLKINDSLKDQIRELQAEILKHVGPDCGGIPDATNLLSAMPSADTPQKASSAGDQPQPLPPTDQSSITEKREEGKSGVRDGSTDVRTTRSKSLSISALSDAYASADPRNVTVEARSAEEIVQAVLGSRERAGRGVAA